MNEKLKTFIAGMDLKNPGKAFIGILMIVAGGVMLKFPDTGVLMQKLVGALATFSGAAGVDLTFLIGQNLDAPTIILSGLGVFGFGTAHKALKGWQHLRVVMNGPAPKVNLDSGRKAGLMIAFALSAVAFSACNQNSNPNPPDDEPTTGTLPTETPETFSAPTTTIPMGEFK